MGTKFVVSEPSSKKSYQIDIEKERVAGLFGKKIGEQFDGSLLNLSGYMLQITGGSDKDGFPMRPDIEGIGRRRALLGGPPGFHPKLKGERKRRSVRGNTLSEDINQVNVKVVKPGDKTLEDLLKPKVDAQPEAKKEDAKTQEKKEAPKA